MIETWICREVFRRLNTGTGKPAREMRIALIVSLVFALFVAATNGCAGNREHRIERSALPRDVERTLTAVSAGAAVRGLSAETERGVTFYEAELVVDGRSKDVLIDAAGAVVEIEEEVGLDALPARVREALLRHAGRSQIVRVESVTRNGSPVAYEARIQTVAKQYEIEVDSEGRLAGPSE
jgi:hypothetical protein